MIANVSPVPWLAIAYGRRMMSANEPGTRALRRRGPQLLGRDFRTPRRQPLFPRHREGGSVHRALRHAPPAHARPPSRAVSSGSQIGPGRRLRRRRHRGNVRGLSDGRKNHHLRARAAGPARRTEYFRDENYNVKNDPRTTIHLRRRAPLHPHLAKTNSTSSLRTRFIRGSKAPSSLYSKQYFELVKQHLNPGGIVTQWVPLYESDLATVKSELATFLRRLPQRHRLGQRHQRRGLRRCFTRPSGAVESQRRQARKPVESSRLRTRRAIHGCRELSQRD